ncbi:hypothetical protein [Actinoplanes sp. NBRC 103695]|uniref:hypothetical protein n=1 Tax=Actinoplanes sp. NBRC 103695 TaxID=3032202 RepID=UPI0024A2A3B8|nr:hypothetical protein [Actinoplanes sp. NBRC 103695]GLZ00426.1 hypothetical protein Acsp02_76780 [Actinoplanes sp. NBRC 103695]
MEDARTPGPDAHPQLAADAGAGAVVRRRRGPQSQAGEGRHPQLAAAMGGTRGGADGFDTIVGRVMTALLDPAE